MTQRELNKLAMKNFVALANARDLEELFGGDVCCTTDENMLETARMHALNKIENLLNKP